MIRRLQIKNSWIMLVNAGEYVMGTLHNRRRPYDIIVSNISIREITSTKEKFDDFKMWIEHCHYVLEQKEGV